MTLLDLESSMAPGTMNNVVDNDFDSLPLAVEHFLDRLNASRLVDCNAAYATDASMRRLDCFIFHQAEMLRSATQTCNIVTPEIMNMLIIILRETYPTSDFCLSVQYAVSKPLLKDTYPALCPYRTADLLVRLPAVLSGSSEGPLTPPSILHDEHSYSTLASPSFFPQSQNGSPLVEMDEYAVLDKTKSDSGNDVPLGENFDMETTVLDGAESKEAEVEENINIEATKDDDCESSKDEDDEDDEDEDEHDDEDDDASQVDEEETKGNDSQLIVSADDDEIQEGTLVCVGLADDIAALLTSALYHRHVTGMGGPLIGLAYAKRSPEVHVVIAWLDQHVDDGNDLPGVHLCYGSEKTCFDLSQPVDALGLALFLADTRDAQLETNYWTHERQLIPWRADLHSSLRGDSFAIDKSTDSNANILKWINAMHRTFSDDSGTKNITSLDPYEESTRDYESVAGVQRQSYTTLRITRDSSETSGAAPLETPQSKSDSAKVDILAPAAPSQFLDMTDVQTKRSVASFASNLSASVFVKRPAKRGTEEEKVVEKRVRAYFVQRKVVSVSVQKSTGKFHLPKQYMECTALQWLHVSPICSPIERPRSCSHIESLMNQLFTEAQQCAQNDLFLGSVHPVVDEVVRDSLCAILHVVAVARDIDDARYLGPISDITDEREAARIAVNEATFRHQWDQIALTIVNSCKSKDISFEREVVLRYPSHPKDNLTAQTSTRDLQYDIRAFWRSLYPEENKTPGAFEDFLRWSSVSDPDECNLNQEPISGKSDSIISLTIPSVFGTNRDASAVNIWSPTFEPVANKPSRDTVPHLLPGGGSLFKSRPRRSYSAEEKKNHGIPIPTTGTDVTMSSASDLSRSTSLGETPEASGTVSERKTAIKRGLHLPLIAEEYKRDLRSEDVSEEAAADQHRLYVVATVKFLSLFNIGNLPVFGLTTSGSKGIVSCGWMERREVSYANESPEVHEATFVADKDIVPLDITSPMDALNLATIVAYIVLVHAQRLRLLFANVDSVDELDDSVKSFLLHPNKTTVPFMLAREQAKKEKKWFKVKTVKGKMQQNAAAEMHSNLDNIEEEAANR